MSEWDQPEYQTLTLSWTRSQTCQQVLWHVQSLGEVRWKDRDRPRHQPEADYLEMSRPWEVHGRVHGSMGAKMSSKNLKKV
jgi:hypothetical protein